MELAWKKKMVHNLPKCEILTTQISLQFYDLSCGLLFSYCRDSIVVGEGERKRCRWDLAVDQVGMDPKIA